MHRILLLLLPLATALAADAPPVCLGSASLGKYRVSVLRPDKTSGLAVRDVNLIPRDARLVWDPVHLPAHINDKSEVAVLVAPVGEGKLLVLPPSKARDHVTWDLPSNAGVIAVVLGPSGLNMQKVRSLMANNDELLQQLADYAQQTSQVEALIQGLSDSQASGSGTDAALRGFASRWGVAMPKLDPHASSDQQAAVLLSAVLPAANAYDPLAASNAQMQQTSGLAASVAGLFFGNSIGIAAGGTALVGNLKSMLFPNTEFRSVFAQTADTGVMEFCTKNLAPKARTKLAFLWAYRVPNVALPVAVVSAPGYIAANWKSAMKLKTAEGGSIKELARAHDWELVPEGGGASIKVPVTVGGPDSLDIDLTKTKVTAGEYRLSASWDWDRAMLGTVHVRPYNDFHTAAVCVPSQDELIEGSGVVTARLIGADFEFVEKAELQKVAPRLPKPAAIRFDLPQGERKGEQMAMTVDIDTSSAGAYRLLLSQADGVPHAIPVTVLPPNPKVTNLPVHANVDETEQKIVLHGAGLARVDELRSEAGDMEGKGDGDTWSGKIRLKAGAKAGQVFSIAAKVHGLETPVTWSGAIQVVGPRPKITAVKKSLPGDPGIEIGENELPSGTSVGLVLALQHLREADDARPQVALRCENGDVRKTLALSPDDVGKGATLSFAGPDSLYLALDPGTVGYPGCDLVASVAVEPRGKSAEVKLGQVVRIPQLEKFTLTSEAVAANTYAGILKGRDLDLIEKAGWDAQNGLPVVGIPTPVPGDTTRETLRIAVPWPSPAPHAPLYIWLRGERSGRRTSVVD